MSFQTVQFIQNDSGFWFFQPDPPVAQSAAARLFEPEMRQDEPSSVDTKTSDVAQSIMPATTERKLRLSEARVKIRREQSRTSSQLYRQRRNARFVQLEEDNARLRAENEFLKQQLKRRIPLSQSTTETA